RPTDATRTGPSIQLPPSIHLRTVTPTKGPACGRDAPTAFPEALRHPLGSPRSVLAPLSHTIDPYRAVYTTTSVYTPPDRHANEGARMRAGRPLPFPTLLSPSPGLAGLHPGCTLPKKPPGPGRIYNDRRPYTYAPSRQRRGPHAGG